MNKKLNILVLALALLALPAAAAQLEVQTAGGSATWLISGLHGAANLVVTGENGFVHRASFPSGVSPFFTPPADGRYNWTLSVAPPTAAKRDTLEAAAVPGGFVEEGLLAVAGGVVSAIAGDTGSLQDNPLRDQVIPDDLIVQGSACVGLDCVNNENFGFDTIRLKENNLRIHFDDTSTQVGFPANDWRLIANDSASGGSSKFSIEDSTAARTPFTVTAGASNNSIFVDSTGRVGLRTSTPVLDLHINTSNTPSIRLEQNNSGGFAAQTWDIGANEANFFVRDVTGGSRLSFRIRPGAPTSSVDISSDGDVGVGTGSPSAKLDVVRTGASTDPMLILNNDQASRFDVRINSTVNGGVDTTWFLQADSDANRTFKISKLNGGGTVVTINNRLDANGTTFVVAGSVSGTAFINTSSRETKTAFSPMNARQVLDKVAGLDIQQWRFKHEGEQMRHVGPVAEDFSAAFGMGPDDKTINLSDANGIAMLAIQGLYEQVQLLQKENAELKTLVLGARQ